MMKKASVTIGERIREMRAKMTQVKFAEAVEIKQAMVSRYEANREVPSPKILFRMAKFTGKTVEWVLTGQDSLLAPISVEELKTIQDKKQTALTRDDLLNLAALHVAALNSPEAREFSTLLLDAFSDEELMGKLLSHYGFLKTSASK
jgi:transcriptional regulator with XRE-family HTH domain